MSTAPENLPVPAPKPKKVPGGNPFASGFVPNGRRKKRDARYISKKNLLKHMLEVDITIQDLPTRMADELRRKLPGVFENVDRRFTMLQVIELVQLQLVFAKSDYVKQDAITAIKDRVYGKPKQTLSLEAAESEPAEIKLPNGRIIVI
jgi:hypothetical protein